MNSTEDMNSSSSSSLEDIPPQSLLTRVKKELSVIARLGLPVVVGNLLNFTMNVTDMIMVGHLGRQALAAVALAITWTLGTMIFAFGMASACDAIMGQAWGSKDYKVIGKCLHIGLIVMTVLCIPIGILWGLTEPLLLWLDQPPELAALTANYVLWLLPGLPPTLYYQVLTRYNACQGVMKPAMYCAVVANIVNIGANYLLIYAMELGFSGAPIATSISKWASVVALALWIKRKKLYVATWVPFSMSAIWKEKVLFKQFLKLGTAGGVGLLFELWAFELSTILASYLGEVCLAAHVILLNVCTFSFMMPLGISVGGAVRSANLLGQGLGSEARFSSKLSIMSGATVMFVNGIIIFSCRHYIGYIYTTDEATIALVAATAPFGAAFQIFDGTFTVSSGILRSMGRHREGAIMAAVGFYVLGVPLGYVFAFHTAIGFPGLWIGLIIGLSTMSALLLTFLFWRTNWKHESELAIMRMKECTKEQIAHHQQHHRHPPQPHNSHHHDDREMQSIPQAGEDEKNGLLIYGETLVDDDELNSSDTVRFLDGAHADGNEVDD
eukprot:ANDGO_02822.mRNA.1 putative transporter C11D3.06